MKFPLVICSMLVGTLAYQDFEPIDHLRARNLKAINQPRNRDPRSYLSARNQEALQFSKRFVDNLEYVSLFPRSPPRRGGSAPGGHGGGGGGGGGSGHAAGGGIGRGSSSGHQLSAEHQRMEAMMQSLAAQRPGSRISRVIGQGGGRQNVVEQLNPRPGEAATGGSIMGPPSQGQGTAGPPTQPGSQTNGHANGNDS